MRERVFGRQVWLWVVCVALCTFAPALARTQVSAEFDRRVNWHSSGLPGERTARLFELWSAADPEQRRVLEEHVAGLRNPRLPAVLTPSHPDLAQALAVGSGNLGWGPEHVEVMVAFGLDLRVIPGAFEALPKLPERDADGRLRRGEPLTVVLAPLFPLPVEEDLTVSLIWIDPAGGEQRARSEVAAPEAFAAGFSMFLRAPLGEPGPWRLALEVARGDAVARGTQVPVEGVSDLARRAQILLAERPELQAEWTWCSEALLESGARAVDRPRLGPWIAVQEGGALPPDGLQRPLELASFPAPIGAVRELVGPWSAKAERAIVVLSGSARGAEPELAGVFGAAWAEVAARLDARIFASGASTDLRSRPNFDTLCSALVTDLGLSEVVVVARRQAVPELQIRMRTRAEVPFSALFLNTLTPSGRRPRITQGLPLCVFDSSVAEDSQVLLDESTRPPSVWRRSHIEPFFADLAVPRELARWLTPQ